MTERQSKIPPPAWLRPYDPADSPGPIPSVVERFRRRRRNEVLKPSEAEAEVARYTVVLVTPEAAEVLGFDRGDAGLRLYRDTDWEHDSSHLDEAVELIEEECGARITLVEHRSDLTYWTAHVRPARAPETAPAQPS